MPAIVELRLRPSRPLRPVVATRQLHGLACAVFEGGQANGGSGGHLSQDKPFSIWPLELVSDGWLLRAAWLPSGLPHSVLAACGQLRLGPVTCAVTDLALRPVSHAELASGPPLVEARLTFLSPIYFAQNGAHVVVPDPRLIAGSWRRRWNASLPPGDPLAIGDDRWRDLHQGLRLAFFDLSTQSRDAGHGHEKVGFAGSVTLCLGRDAPVPACRDLGTLARFAEFCGTGAQTTHGFGATTLSGRREQPSLNGG